MVRQSGNEFNAPAVSIRRPSREAAQDLLDRGISAIPLVGKEPPRGFPLSRCFSHLPTEADLDYWFPDGGENVGAVLGEVSGGACVRDFDDNASFERWASEHPELSATLPVARTGREGGGWHVWFYPDPGDVADGRSWVTCGDGELRIRNCFVAVPSSRHPVTGVTYSWQQSLDGLAYVADLQAAGLGPSGTHELDGGWGEPLDIPSDLEEAIRLTLPEDYGMRWTCIFRFARALKSMPQFQDADGEELQAVFRQWWTAALPRIRTKTWRESRRDFREGWRRVRKPWGSAIVCRAFAEAKGEGIDRLVDACRRIHIAQNGQPFFLAGRTAARMLNMPHRTVARWLKRLGDRGVLVPVEVGDYRSKAATVYRYAGRAD